MTIFDLPYYRQALQRSTSQDDNFMVNSRAYAKLNFVWFDKFYGPNACSMEVPDILQFKHVYIIYVNFFM